MRQKHVVISTGIGQPNQPVDQVKINQSSIIPMTN